jgi:hypothetical protein
MSRRVPIQPLSEARLRALTTPRLIAYKARVLTLHETCWHDPDRFHAPGLLHHKSDPGYAEYLGFIKTILAEREHVDGTT